MKVKTLYDIQASRWMPRRSRFPHAYLPAGPTWLQNLRRQRFRRPGHLYLTSRQKATIRRLARSLEAIEIDPALRPKDRK